jgi:DNA-binding response OmpR family regulator
MTEIAREQKRVLVVGEECAARSRMAAGLEQSGYAVVLGHDGLEVLALAQRHEPHIIVLFAALPAALGVEVLQSLRRRSALHAIPMILLGADVMLIVEAGVQCVHVVKDQPIALEQVLGQVGRVTRQA